MLDSAKCIRAIKRIEESKAESLAIIKYHLRIGRVTEDVVPLVMEVDKCRAMDKLFMDE